MRLFGTALLATSVFIGYVSGSNINQRELSIADLPACGLTCILQSISAAGCSISDTECLCHRPAVTDSSSQCLSANCTAADTLGTSKVQASVCNKPHESKTGLVFAILTTVYAIVVVSVALRFAARLLTASVRVDDWLILVALLLGTVAWIFAYKLKQNNFGKHLWDLESGQLRNNLLYFYIDWNLYVFICALVKVSLVAFYLQIFHDRRFRIFCWIVIGFITIVTLVIQFLTIFSCIPVQAYWDRDIKGKCMDIKAVAYAYSALSIFEDLVILIMPMPSVWSLQMKKSRKFAVAFMFAVGVFGCTTTMLRLNALTAYKITSDPTWDYIYVVIWTGAELAACIVCASLPAVRQLLLMIIPSRLSKFLTDRSLSRGTAGANRGQTPSLQKKHEGHSLSSMPPEHGKSSFGVQTGISTSSWPKFQAETVQDIERGHVSGEQTKPSTWNLLRKEFLKKLPIFQTSSWSSADQSESPPVRVEPTRRPNVTSFQAMSSRTDNAEATRKASFDEELELLQVPGHSRRASEGSDNEHGDGMALPQKGVLVSTRISQVSR